MSDQFGHQLLRGHHWDGLHAAGCVLGTVLPNPPWGSPELGSGAARLLHAGEHRGLHNLCTLKVAPQVAVALRVVSL